MVDVRGGKTYWTMYRFTFLAGMSPLGDLVFAKTFEFNNLFFRLVKLAFGLRAKKGDEAGF